jgi:hypothetical protein
MKRNAFLLLTALLLSLVTGCENSELQEPVRSLDLLPVSVKGYELYSWKTDGYWNYTLISGTNRNKSYDEIVTVGNVEDGDWIKITVHDLNNLKQLLNRVPANESISWINASNRVPGFSLPEITTVAQILNHCSDLDLNLQIVE